MEKERKRLLVRAHPPLFKALERVRRAKDVFRGKRDGKRGGFVRSGHRVYANAEHTRRFHGKLFVSRRVTGCACAPYLGFRFRTFHRATLAETWRKRKKGKKKKRKKRSERSFLGRSVNRAWKGRAFLANGIVTCTPFKVGPSDSDLGFDENRGERDDNTVILSFFLFFLLAFCRFRFVELEEYC